MTDKIKFIFINKQDYPPIEKCEDARSVYKHRAKEFLKQVVARCPNATYLTNTLGRQVLLAIPENELNAEQLAQELNCSIYKQIAG